MTEAVFGPAGNSDSFYQRYKTFQDVPRYVSEMGLNAFEYQFGRGVRMRPENAEILRRECAAEDVEMSAHAPYYISLASADEEKRLGSLRYVLETAEAVTRMGGSRLVLHPGSAGKFPRDEAMRLAADTLKRAMRALDEAGYSGVTVCPETMGKINQLGSLDEVMALCLVDDRLIPCIDFGHLNARTNGGIREKGDYAAILDRMADVIGTERARSFHAHFSKIEYTAGGEKRHLTFADTVFGPDPFPLMELIAERGLTPHLICESDGTQAEDARAMREAYLRSKGGGKA